MAQRPTPNQPGRPRSFCEEDALDAAMGVFASKGYESASLADLTDAMGINRVSMYATFGNKEALFVKALTRYTDAGDRRLASIIAGGSARKAVENLLRDSVRRFTDPKAVGVCFVTQAPLPEHAVSGETRQYVAGKRASIELLLKQLLVRAVESGELSPEISPTALARFLSVVIQGLASQSQHGGTRLELLRVVDVAMATLPPVHFNV